MLTHHQLCARRIRRHVCSAVFAATLMWSPVYASGQTAHQPQDQPSLFRDVVKRVVIDPTTYVPAIAAYDATMRDWNTSQPFFRNGFVEHNPRFTVTGRPDDPAVGYVVGRRRILADALANLELSAFNNMTDSLVEHVLADKYPNHRKLIRALGWVEKSAFASYMSYRLSAAHYRQWQENLQRSSQLGFK